MTKPFEFFKPTNSFKLKGHDGYYVEIGYANRLLNEKGEVVRCGKKHGFWTQWALPDEFIEGLVIGHREIEKEPECDHQRGFYQKQEPYDHICTRFREICPKCGEAVK